MLKESVRDGLLEKIIQASVLYYRLILFVAPSGAGKTTILRDVAALLDSPVINVNLELSRRMLELTERQRRLELPRLLSDMVNENQAEVCLLDNIELLFAISLKQDPLRLLQVLSRNKTIVAAWNGSIDSRCIMYATPGHPEYKRYPLKDFLVVCPEAE